MRQITFLTSDNQTYVSTAPRDPQDTAVPDRPSPDHFFDRESWAWAVPPTSLEEARAAKIAEINRAYDTVIEYIQAGYPLKEVLTWERQAAQARELKEDPGAPALFVRGLAAAKELPVEEMCRRILANAESWEPVAAGLTARRQLLEEAVWAAHSVADVSAVRVSYNV